MTGQRPSVAVCEACGEAIIWCVTATGAKMPVDVEPVEGGNVILTAGPAPVAHVVSKRGRQRAGRTLYTSHFATCPAADKFRTRDKGKGDKRGKPKAPAEQGDLFGGRR